MSFFASLIPKLLAVLPSGCDNSFFGIPAWYKYLPMESDGKVCSVSDEFQLLGSGTNSGLLLIGLALIDIGLRLAGMVAVGYIIYGGFSFMTSQGEPQAAAKARQTILNACIGLGIAILATGLVVFVGNTLSK